MGGKTDSYIIDFWPLWIVSSYKRKCIPACTNLQAKMYVITCTFTQVHCLKYLHMCIWRYIHRQLIFFYLFIFFKSNFIWLLVPILTGQWEIHLRGFFFFTPCVLQKSLGHIEKNSWRSLFIFCPRYILRFLSAKSHWPLGIHNMSPIPSWWVRVFAKVVNAPRTFFHTGARFCSKHYFPGINLTPKTTVKVRYYYAPKETDPELE